MQREGWQRVADNMQKYLEFVKDFNDNVYTNAELIAERKKHASAIASAVSADPANVGRPDALL